MQIPTNSIRRHQLPWGWSYQLWATCHGCWVPNWGPSEKLQTLLTTEPSPKFPEPFVCRESWKYKLRTHSDCLAQITFVTEFMHQNNTATALPKILLSFMTVWKMLPWLIATFSGSQDHSKVLSEGYHGWLPVGLELKGIKNMTKWPCNLSLCFTSSTVVHISVLLLPCSALRDYIILLLLNDRI